MDVTTKTYVFDGGIVVEHQVTDELPSRHRLVIGGMAGEWAHWKFLASLPLGPRMFIGVADGRAILPRCFEAVEGSLIDG